MQYTMLWEGKMSNIKNSKYKTRQGVHELFTKLNGSSCQFRIPNTAIIAAAMISIFGIILIAAAMTHRHENSVHP